MAELTAAMEQERDKLERAKASVAATSASAVCAGCKEQLSSKGAPTTTFGAPVNRSLGDGQYSVVSSFN